MDDDEMIDHVRDAIMVATETREAVRRSSGPVSVSIHVGSEVFAWLRARAIHPSGAITPGAQSLYGFPLYLEDAWQDRTRIEIHTRRVVV